MERYVFRLIKESGVYQEVFPEREYSFCGSKSFSPDVLARQGKSVLFVDSKSTVPKIGIRLFDLQSYEDNIHIVAENINKLYKQMHRFERYNPFLDDTSSEVNDFWGIVIVLEDAYIRRVLYYEEAGRLLKIKEKSGEWEWMITHIKVMSLYEIERLCLYGKSIIDACGVLNKDDPLGFSFVNGMSNDSNYINGDYNAFCERVDNEAMCIIKEMINAGLLQ